MSGKYDWTKIPTESKIRLEITVENKECLDDFPLEHSRLKRKSSKINKKNDYTVIVDAVYSHNCDNCTIYGISPEEGVYQLFRQGFTTFLVPDGEDPEEFYEKSDYDEIEVYGIESDHTAKIVHVIPNDTQKPLNFVSIDSKYLETLKQNYKKLHLAHDYMDQGWTDIENGEDIEHLGNEEAFWDESGEITIFSGEGFWINEKDFSKLCAVHDNQEQTLN